MKLYRDIVQGSEEWYAARLGRICASHLNKIIDRDGKLRKARSGAGPAESVKSYIYDVVSERVCTIPANPWEGNMHTRYGQDLEPAARAALNFEADMDFVRIGGVESDDGMLWASTDGAAFDSNGELIATCEIKIPAPKTVVRYTVDRQQLLEDYWPQVALAAILTHKPAWLYCYAPEMRSVQIVVEPTGETIGNLVAALGALREMIDSIEREVRG